MEGKKLYLKRVKKEFKFLGKEEKKYLKNLVYQIENYGQKDNLSYEQYVARFGEPKEILISFYENSEITDLEKKFQIKRHIIIIVITVVCIVALLFILFLLLSYLDARSSNINNLEIKIEEVK